MTPVALLLGYMPLTLIHDVIFVGHLLKYKSIKDGNLMVCGDLNSVVDPNLDSSADRKAHSSLQSLLLAEDVYDSRRCLHISERDYTYYSYSHNSYSHFFLVDKLKKVVSSEISDITWSDQ